MSSVATDLTSKTESPAQRAARLEAARMRDLNERDPLIGYPEMAELAGVRVQTAWEWKKRNLLPDPSAVLPGRGRVKWRRSVAIAWLESTGRIPPGSITT